jgi:hypothetical protein
MNSWIIEKTIDLKKPPQSRQEQPYLLMLPGDENAHKWVITVLVDGEPADLSGYAASGEFLRHNNTLVTCSGANAAIDGNIVTITFRAECYNVPGGMRGAVRLSGTVGTVTLADQAFIVQPDMSGEVVVDEYIPSLAALLGQLSQLEQQNEIGMVLTAISGIMAAHVEDTTLVIDKVAITDAGAYAAAVAAGYTGTEADWNAFVASVTNNTAMITQANQNASQALTAANAKAAVTSASLTALANGWSETSPYTQTISCSIATATNNLIVGVGGTLTDEQKTTIDQANIVCTGQGAGTITLTAYGAKPEVDIPINVLGVN